MKLIPITNRRGESMKKRKHTVSSIAGCIGLCAWALSACGQGNISGTAVGSTLAVSKDGTVTSYLVADFDKDYYDISELRDMVLEEVREYNEQKAANGESAKTVRVESVEKTPDGTNQAVVRHVFDSPQAYRDFTGNELYYGTIARAYEQGYTLDVSMVDVRDAAVIGKEEIAALGKWYLLIAEEKMELRCPKKIRYVNEGAVLNEDGTVSPSDEEGYTYIIMK
ncbi:MAG: hypothetical protein LBQ15_05890 [Clostridium sp.]|jgi:hypothetical protein|nr:hypothetical protein [Clostridium sp.]